MLEGYPMGMRGGWLTDGDWIAPWVSAIWGGLYKEYEPIDTHYVWQSTKRRRWFGPTWAEVSFVYLLGGKGGKR